MLNDVDVVTLLGLAKLCDQPHPRIGAQGAVSKRHIIYTHDGEIEDFVRYEKSSRVQAIVLPNEKFAARVVLVIELCHCSTRVVFVFQDMVVCLEKAWPYQESGGPGAADFNSCHAAAHGDGEFEVIDIEEIAGADDPFLRKLGKRLGRCGSRAGGDRLGGQQIGFGPGKISGQVFFSARLFG